MNKKIVVLLITCGMMFASSFDIELKKDSWNLVGTSEDLNLTSLNLNDDDIVWQYKNNNWFCNKEITEYEKIDNIEANGAFWVYATNDSNISIEQKVNTFTSIKSGWNMYSFGYNKDLNNLDTSIVPVVWQYDNNWTVWDTKNIYKNTYEIKNSLVKGKGSWIYSYDNELIDRVEDMWDLKLPIDISKNYENLNIVIQFIKPEDDGDPDTGSFTYKTLSIINQNLSNPSKIYVTGAGDSGSKSDIYQVGGYNPNNVVENSIELENNKLVLKLGSVVKFAQPDQLEKFKTKATYNITIIADQPIFENNITQMDMTIEIK